MSRRTIQSPGVEIREIDLTQRPAAAVGTSVFIAGFSDQGPTDEIFNVVEFLASSKSSFLTGSLIIADGGQTRST